MNNTQLYYSSEWDIDQLDDSGEVDSITLVANTFSPTSVTIKNFNLNFPPVIDGNFQIVGDTIWRQFGDSSTVTLLNLPTFFATTSTTLSLVYYNFNGSDVSINIRYYLWTDKINVS